MSNTRTFVEVINFKEVDIDDATIMGEISEVKKFGGFEYTEIPIRNGGKDLVVKTPKEIFTYGVMVDSSGSCSIKLRIDNTGEENKAFLKMLRKFVKKCENRVKEEDEEEGRDIPVKLLYETKTLFECGLNSFESFYVYARVPKACDLWERTPDGRKRIRATDLVDKKGSIRGALRFRCVTISERGATVKLELMGAVVWELKDTRYNVIDYLTSDEEGEEDE